MAEPLDDGSGFQPRQTPPEDDPAGFNPIPEQVDDGFIPREADTSGLKTYVEENIKKAQAEKQKREPIDTAVKPVPAENWADALAAGWGMSVAGLIGRGESSPLEVGPDSGRIASIMSTVGQLAGDAPLMVTGGVIGGIGGAIAGAPIGGAAGTMVAPGVGTLVGASGGAVAGGIIGADFLGNALPEGLRKYMMEHYEKGDITNSTEFFDRLSAVTWSALKGGAIGVATMGAGRAAGPLLTKAAPALSTATTQTIAKTTAEIGTMVTVASAFEGKLPDADDFINAGIVVGGLGASLKVASKLRQNFVGTGEHPIEIVEKAARDVEIKQKLLVEDPPLPSRSTKPPDPPPEMMGKPKLQVVDDSFKPDAELAAKNAIDGDKPPGGGGGEPPVMDPPATPPAPEVVGGWFRDYYNKVSVNYRKSLDDVAALDMAEKALAKDGVQPSQSPFLLARNFKGVDTKAYKFAFADTRDFKTQKINGEGLEQIFKELPQEVHMTKVSDSDLAVLSRLDPEALKNKPIAWQKLTAYRVAKRVVNQLEGRGIETGVDLEAARKVIADSAPLLEGTSARLEALSDRALQYLIDSGIVSQASGEKIRQFKDYVPLHRLQDDDPFSVTGQKGNSLKRIKGSENLILDPQETMINNIQTMVKMAEKQRIFNSMADLQLRAGEDAPSIFIKRTAKMEPIKIEAEVIEKFLNDTGAITSEKYLRKELKKQFPNLTEEQLQKVIEQEGRNITEIKDALTVFRPMKMNMAENEFPVARDGKREVWATHKDYADAVAALNYSPPEMNVFMKLMALPAKTLRLGTALSPDFIVRNIWRDQIGASVQSKYGHIPLYDAFVSLGKIWKDDSAWRDYLASGAFSGGLGQFKGLMDTDLYKLNQETKFRDRVWNVVTKPIHALEVASTLAENVPRFSEFRKSGAIEGGINERVRGTFAAREVTVDFDRAGAWARKVSIFTPFMNVGIQGTDRFVRGFKENPTRTMALAVATISVPSFFTWLNGHNDSRYKDAPMWQKRQFWVIPTDNWEQATSQEDYDVRPDDLKRIGPNGELMVNNGITFRLPKPFEAGILFGTVLEEALGKFADQDPRALKDIDEAIGQALIPNMVPSVVIGVTEHLANRSFFLDSTLVSPHAEQLLPEDRYSSYTSETAKQIAKLIGYVPYIKDIGSKATPLNAPAVVDNYLQVWGGTGGKYLVQLSDSLLKKTGISDKAEKPAWTWGDVPILKAFIMKYPTMKAEPIREFYVNYDKATQIMNSMKLAIKNQDEARYNDLEDKYGDKIYRIQESYKMLGDANKLLNNLQNTDKGPTGEVLSPDERTQLMTTTWFQMTEMAKAANQITDELKKEAEKEKQGE
jgi:hypothetical protein